MVGREGKEELDGEEREAELAERIGALHALGFPRGRDAREGLHVARRGPCGAALVGFGRGRLTRPHSPSFTGVKTQNRGCSLDGGFRRSNVGKNLLAPIPRPLLNGRGFTRSLPEWSAKCRVN